MYAVIRTGGKQYRVAPNDVIQVERLSTGPGKSVDFEEVLLVGEGAAATAGTPLVEGAKVRAEVLEEVRGEKIIVFKKKRRQGYRRKQGHRQNLTVLRITDITDADGKTVSAAGAKPAVKSKAPDKKRAAKPKIEAKAAETMGSDEKPGAKPKTETSKAGGGGKPKAAPKKKAGGTAAKAGAAKAKAAPKAKSTKTAAKSAPKKGSAKEKK